MCVYRYKHNNMKPVRMRYVRAHRCRRVYYYYYFFFLRKIKTLPIKLERAALLRVHILYTYTYTSVYAPAYDNGQCYRYTRDIVVVVILTVHFRQTFGAPVGIRDWVARAIGLCTWLYFFPNRKARENGRF